MARKCERVYIYIYIYIYIYACACVRACVFVCGVCVCVCARARMCVSRNKFRLVANSHDAAIRGSNPLI